MTRRAALLHADVSPASDAYDADADEVDPTMCVLCAISYPASELFTMGATLSTPGHLVCVGCRGCAARARSASFACTICDDDSCRAVMAGMDGTCGRRKRHECLRCYLLNQGSSQYRHDATLSVLGLDRAEMPSFAEYCSAHARRCKRARDERLRDQARQRAKRAKVKHEA